MTYPELLQSKQRRVEDAGFEANLADTALFDFQKFIVQRALKAGRYAIFADCGMGKTIMQIVWSDCIVSHTGMPVLILAPLAVVAQTIEEGKKFGYVIKEAGQGGNIEISNYEQLDNIDCTIYGGVVLDESSILKNFTGVYKNKIIDTFKTTPYKLACTATPAPNDLNEIGNHSAFLNILDAQDMRSKWFIRDEGMNNYRLKTHAKKDFYAWVSSWATMICNPADIGFDGSKFILPDLNFIEKKITTESRSGGYFNSISVNATNFNKELRLTKVERLSDVCDTVNNSTASFIIWVNHNDEGPELLKQIKDSKEVKGSDTDKYKKQTLLDFANGKFRVLITKAKIAGFGMNFQNCHNQVFASMDFSFEKLYQQIRRSYRFGQTHDVNIYLVTTDTMQNVTQSLKRKQKQFEDMQQEMNKNINSLEYGLINDYEFKEVKTDKFHLMKGDSCIEIKRIPDNSVDFIIFSPPFSSLFTYSNYIHDMGNNESHEGFFEQYAYLLKDLYRILKPGRLMCCHTKDLGVYKNSSGYTGIYDFTNDHTSAVLSEKFKLHCKINIWTDPVLEMQRTKTQRLLYKQITSDSSYTGVGMAEYITVFRKWEGPEENFTPITGITKQNFPLDTWQEWASPTFKEDLSKYSKDDLIKTIKKQKADIFKLRFDCNDNLPEKFYDDVWFDIMRTDVLNGKEGTAMGDEKHIAPLQLEVIHRCVTMWTNKGETVFTPFLGIGSEVYQSIKDGRKGIGIELKDSYFDVSVKNCQTAETQSLQKTFFDL